VEPKISDQRRANRLSRQKSPYLLQHQFNPVDWYAWGEEAFNVARSQNKPIFLSIGYSTCHWCHVMERESFEDAKVAAVLNDHFVSIKVDREERPDVDKIYMSFVQATTGQGGWPLNVFLTPELKPFYGGTYFPPQARYGRASFEQVLRHVAGLWETRQGDVLRSAEDLHARLSGFNEQNSRSETALNDDALHHAAAEFKKEYDPQHGGFGGAPKFPRPSQPAFLLAYGARYNDKDAIAMVLHTCERMAAGGMYDQLGGGFARYSVDAQWLVPHFEKMLYDNAQLVNLYLDAYLISGQDPFAQIARETLIYLTRDMMHPQGGFYSAEDADSEGKEGKFYCWTRAELSSLLTPEEFNVAVRWFGITEEGNFVDHSDPNPLPHQNVLSVADPQLPPEDAPLLASAKKKMFQARAGRVRPHLDDKILASWNGLMLGALSRAAVVLKDEDFRAIAEANLAFLKRNLWEASTQTLYHRWRDGERDTAQLLSGYAFLLSGVVDLYEATVNPRHLDFAIALAESMINKFADRENGGFWQSPPDSADLILRVKDDYDGAEPSGNSIACLALLKLAAITGRKDFKDSAEQTLAYFGDRMRQIPQAVPQMLLAHNFWLEDSNRVALVGDFTCSSTLSLLEAAHSVYQPKKIVMGNTGAVDPFVKSLPLNEECTFAFVCSGTACQPPTRDPKIVRNLLHTPLGSPR
jgi:uncharacterized protein YyaL (SSP411 family)